MLVPCNICGEYFNYSGTTGKVCPRCRKGIKKADPYGVYKEEPFAEHRKCRTPGCDKKVRISALYCDACRAKRTRSLDDTYYEEPYKISK